MRVVGIMLVRNEDFYVEPALRNALPFCDLIHVADHRSTDRTGEILRRLQAEFPEKIRLQSIAHPRESHEMIRPYAGTDTWVFGIDGDEIYDPAGLLRFRKTLESGVHDGQWAIFGNVLNVRAWDTAKENARGHLAPPCRSMTKLYNFRIISDWRGRDCVERLHGGEISFQPGFNDTLRLDLHKDLSWEETDFRCLHLCFLPRSSQDKNQTGPRQNIMDRHSWTLAKVMEKLRGLLQGRPAPDWKEQRYGRGPLVDLSYRPFFPPGWTPPA